MIQSVFKRKRRVEGKLVSSENYHGQYSLTTGGKIFRVALDTSDKEIARRRLKDIVLEKQRESEGIIAPSLIRKSAALPINDLLSEYEADLYGRGLRDKHVHDSMTRLIRMAGEMKWRVVGDIRPDSFLRWRRQLECSAKTNKEYQVSLSAFLNWLVKTERILVNPLAKVECVETRGKEVRVCRSFTEGELRRLFCIAGKRLLAYQMLAYTGQRHCEVDALVWDDLHLEGPQPYALFRADTTKDKDKRAVPLRLEIVKGLLEIRPRDFDASRKVFWWRMPTYDILRADLVKAGIEHTDSMGRVVHFHSFRKTFQTMGVRCGVNQRSAQAILGHSDPSMTANVYTDVPALELHAEVAKFPWISEVPDRGTQKGAQITGAVRHPLSLADMMAQLIEAVKVIEVEQARQESASAVTSCHSDEMAARAGIEPATK
jgi:integrase